MQTQNSEFNLSFQYNDLFEYAALLANNLQVPFVNNQIIYPPHIAEGSSKFFKINDYMSYQVAHYKAKQKMVFNRYPTISNHVTTTFQDFTFARCNVHQHTCNEIILNNNSLGSVQCKSTRSHEVVVIEPGLEVKVILVMMKENWAENILHDSVSNEKFLRYLINQDANLRKEFLSQEQNRLFKEVFEGKAFTLLQHLYYDGRILNLLESFLKDILTKEDAESPYLFASYEDVRMLQVAEQYINDHLMKPFPGVEVLSRISCMSRTKFITLFQKVYGLSSFEYSQKKRLAIAYEYMKTGKHNVSDTAQIIGYAGVNNFAVAFKKEFGLLPSQLLERVRV